MRLLLLVVILFTAGCSTKQYDYTQGQYCYTDQQIVKQDEVVSSTTVLECTDRPSRQSEIQRAGIDSGCNEFWYPEFRNGTRIMTRGVVCEKLNGNYEIVDIDGSNR